MKSEQQTDNIKEFIYLDVERVKSVYAQYEKGLLKSKNTNTNTESQISAEVGTGNILDLFGINAKGMGEILRSSQKSETKTLHDYMYNQVEETLKNKDKLVKIGFNGENKKIKNLWDNGNLQEELGTEKYVLVKGRVMIEDYEKLTVMAEKINELLISLEGLEQGNESNKSYDDLLSLLNKNNELFTDVFIESFKNVLNNLYGTRLVMKIHPFSDKSNLKFISILNRDYLRDSIDNIIFNYGTYPIQEWYILGKVATIVPKDYNPFEEQDYKKNIILKNQVKISNLLNSNKNFDDLNNQNKIFWKDLGLNEADFYQLKNDDLENQFEILFKSLNDLYKESNPKFPSVSLIPIAIYTL